MGSFFGWMLESSLFVLMILGIRRAFTGRVRYAGIYALWLVVLLRFLVPVNVISTPFSVGDVVSQKISAWKLTQSGQEGHGDASLSGKIGGEQVETGALIDLESVEPLPGGQQKESVEILERDGADSVTASPGNQVLQKLVSIADWNMVLKGGWLAVSGAFLLCFFLSNLCLLRRLRRSRSFWGTKGKVKIYAVSGMRNPCLYGFFRPVIYIPADLVLGKEGVRAEEGELEQIITHEYVHYLHRDHIWGMVRMFLVSAYWFHPFVWLAVSCSKKDAELFCDETVIAMLGEDRRFCYGEMLVRLAGEARWGDFRYSLMPMSRRGKEMERRIRAISDRKRYSRWMLLPLLVIVAATLGITCSTGVGPLEKGKKIVSQASERGGKPEKGGGDTREEKSKKGGVEQALQSELILSEYQKRLENFQQVSGLNVPGVGKARGKGTVADPGQRQAKEMNAPAADNETEKFEVSAEKAAAVSGEYREVFLQYIQTFTEAVNTGDTGKMRQVLAEGSEVYKQQCDMVKNYHKRGIREEVEDCIISAVVVDTPSQVKIHSKERIRVSYRDATTKVVKQRYQYTCEMLDGEWIITGMEELS